MGKKKGVKKAKYGVLSQEDDEVELTNAFQFSPSHAPLHGNVNELKQIPDDKSVNLKSIASQKRLSVGDQLSEVTTTVYDAGSCLVDSDVSETDESYLNDSSSSSDMGTALLNPMAKRMKSATSVVSSYKEWII